MLECSDRGWNLVALDAQTILHKYVARALEMRPSLLRRSALPIPALASSCLAEPPCSGEAKALHRARRLRPDNASVLAA